MADRVYPASKPPPPPPPALVPPPPGAAGVSAAANGRPTAPPSFPPTKSQMHAPRPTYRPQPPPKRRPRRRRSCCCACFLWLTLLFLALILLAAIACGAFYVLYRPHRPTFTVSSLRLTALNITSSGQLTSRLDLSVTARNPNSKIAFIYAPSYISVTTSGVDIGDGSFPAFIHGARNTTVLKTTASTTRQTLDATVASDLEKKTTIPLEIDVITKAGVKIAGVKTSKIGIRVRCVNISVRVPKGKGKVTAASPDASCKVKLRIKIWKWTIYFP